jgi:hypothetical protein
MAEITKKCSSENERFLLRSEELISLICKNMDMPTVIATSSPTVLPTGAVTIPYGYNVDYTYDPLREASP